jgi:hypothetical protein
MERKIKRVQTVPIQDLYKDPSVKQGDFRVYKEALGIISKEDIKREQQ